MGVWDTITDWLSLPSKPLDWTVRGLFDLFDGSDEEEKKKRPQIQPIHQMRPKVPGSSLNSGIKFPQVYPDAQTDPMQEYLNQLLRGIGSGAPEMRSIQELRAMAQSQVNPQFNPQIEAIRGDMSATKSRANENKQDIRSMYEDLAQSYLGDVETSKSQTANAKQAESAALAQLQKSLQGQYSTQQNAQAQELESLGLSAALGESTKGQKEDLQFLNALNTSESAAQQRAIDALGLADQSYYQKGRGIAQMEGNENVTDLMSRLEDYLRQSQGQVSQLEGQRASAIQQLVNQMQMSQSEGLADYQNERWDRLLQIAQLQRALTNDAYSRMEDNTTQEKPPSKGLLGAYSVLQNNLGGQSAGAINAFMNLLQTQPFREGRFEAENKQIVEMTPENAAYQARLYAAENKLSPQETNALVRAVYAYYGKLR